MFIITNKGRCSFRQLPEQHQSDVLTICGSFDRLTQPEISFNVSRFTVLILRIKGCFVTISPVTQRRHTVKLEHEES